MKDSSHILISLEERFAEGILNGSKMVELRRRPMRLSEGTTVWMYAKVPAGKVIGSVKVRALQTSTPKTLWRKYGSVSGLQKEEFFEYFSGIEQGFVLILDTPARMKKPVSLEQLRSLNSTFQPPQFFQHLESNGAFVTAFAA